MSDDWEKVPITIVDRTFGVFALAAIMGPLLGLTMFGIVYFVSTGDTTLLKSLIYPPFWLGAYFFGGIQAVTVGVCFGWQYARTRKIHWLMPLTSALFGNLIFGMFVTPTEPIRPNSIMLLVVVLSVLSAYVVWALLGARRKT